VSYILLFPFFFSLPLFFILHVFYLFKNSIIMFTIAAFTALLSLASIAYAQEGAAAPSSVAALVAQLRTAPTEVDRFRLLSDDQFLFDFVNPGTTVGVTTGAGGRTVAATSENFPAIVGNGVSMSTCLRSFIIEWYADKYSSYRFPWPLRHELASHTSSRDGD
jgi:hypothetical protein